MPDLLIRDIPEATYAELEAEAAANGVSVNDQAIRRLGIDPVVKQQDEPRPPTLAEKLAAWRERHPDADFGGVEFPPLRMTLQVPDFSGPEYDPPGGEDEGKDGAGGES